MPDVQLKSNYDLPAGYDDTKITLLSQDPHWLYVYWEISDSKRSSFYEDMGSSLWEKSVPVLKVSNVSKNEIFYIRINDFSTNWYINVADSSCLYTVEIGRKVSDRFFVNLASSNYIVTPGDAVSSNTSAFFVDYKKLCDGNIYLEYGKIYENHSFDSYENGICGISSEEFFGIDFKEDILGISSAELFGINLRKNFGISSDNLINRNRNNSNDTNRSL